MLIHLALFLVKPLIYDSLIKLPAKQNLKMWLFDIWQPCTVVHELVSLLWDLVSSLGVGLGPRGVDPFVPWWAVVQQDYFIKSHILSPSQNLYNPYF